MGTLTVAAAGTPNPNAPQPTSLTDCTCELYTLMNRYVTEWEALYPPGALTGHTFTSTIQTNGKSQKAYYGQGSQQVTSCTVQNNGATDELTVGFTNPMVAGKGIVLGVASGTNNGGSHDYGPIDLGTLYIIGATAGDPYTIEWFT